MTSDEVRRLSTQAVPTASNADHAANNESQEASAAVIATSSLNNVVGLGTVPLAESRTALFDISPKFPRIDDVWRAEAPESSQNTNSLKEDENHITIGSPDPYLLEKTEPRFLISRLLNPSDVGSAALFCDFGTLPIDHVFDEQKVQSDYEREVSKRKDTFAKAAADRGVLPNHPKTLQATIEELQLARPHHNAYFSPSKSAWFVFSSVRKHASGRTDRAVCSRLHDEDKSGPNEHLYCRLQFQVDPRYFLRLGADGTLGGPTIWGWPSGESHRDIALAAPEDFSAPSTVQESSHGEWYNLWGCPSCYDVLYISSAGGGIPGIFTRDEIQTFEQSRQPPLGTPEHLASTKMLAQAAWNYIFRVVKETVFFGERRPLNVEGLHFQRAVGWDSQTEAVFGRLGYTYDHDSHHLIPPDISRSNARTMRGRAVLFRAFTEIGLKLISNAMLFPQIPVNWREANKVFTIQPALERIAKTLGGNRIPTLGQHVVSGRDDRDEDYRILGATASDPDTYIQRAYRAASLQQGFRKPLVFGSLSNIAEARQSESLQTLVVTERSTGAYAIKDLLQAYQLLDVISTEDNGAMQIDEVEGVWSAIDDEHLVESYRVKLCAESDPERHHRLQDAMGLIRRSRESPLLDGLLTSIEGEGLDLPMNVERARALLQISPSLEDDFVSSTYVMLVAESPERETEYRKALFCIAEDRNSAVLRDFLAQGNTASSGWETLAGNASHPVGLRNTGNTCFLNSLLQYLFTIRELREIVLHMTEYEEVDREALASRNKRVGGRVVTEYEIARSKRFVTLLRDLFLSLMTSSDAAITPERELEYLALETAIRADDGQIKSAETVPSPEEVSRPDLVHRDAQRLSSPSVLGKRRSEDPENDFMDVDLPAHTPLSERQPNQAVALNATITPAAVSTGCDLIAVETVDGVTEIGTPNDVNVRSKRRNSFTPPNLPPRRSSTRLPAGKGALLYGRQNDVSECLDAMLFKLEVALDMEKLRTAGIGANGSIVQKLFTGTTRQILETIPDVGSRNTISDSVDPFNYLLVDAAREGCDLYDALDRTFDEDVVDWNGTKASRRYLAQHLPPVLQIQLQRVQYDTESKRTFKSNAFLALPPTLYMDRYIDSGADDPAARQRQDRTRQLKGRLEAARSRLTALQTLPVKKQAPRTNLPDVLRNAGDLLEQLAHDEPDLWQGDHIVAESLAIEADNVKIELAELHRRIIQTKEEMEQLWSLATDHEYELVSVFMHRGEANFGHYFLYQRDISGVADRWLKLNDEQVSEVSGAEVFRDTTGSTLNPYWLAYVRKGALKIIEAVTRDIDRRMT